MSGLISKALPRRTIVKASALLFLSAPATPLFAMNTELPYQIMSADDAHHLMQTNPSGIFVIDVRSPAEFQNGHIAGAVNIPLDEFEAGRIPAAVPNDSTPKLLYCRSGRRSGIAAEILAKAGYRNVYNFGGVMDWPFGLVR